MVCRDGSGWICSTQTKGLMMYEIIYWISTTVVIVGFLFAIRLYKELGVIPILITGMYMITALWWHEFAGDFSDMLYDISFIVATFCVFNTQRIAKNSCKTAPTCHRRKK